MAIPKGHRANFDTLLRAAAAGDLSLVECRRKRGGRKLYVLCAVHRDGTDYVLTPMAKMFDGNPFNEVVPPAGVKEG